MFAYIYANQIGICSFIVKKSKKEIEIEALQSLKYYVGDEIFLYENKAIPAALQLVTDALENKEDAEKVINLYNQYMVLYSQNKPVLHKIEEFQYIE